MDIILTAIRKQYLPNGKTLSDSDRKNRLSKIAQETCQVFIQQALAEGRSEDFMLRIADYLTKLQLYLNERLLKKLRLGEIAVPEPPRPKLVEPIFEPIPEFECEEFLALKKQLKAEAGLLSIAFYRTLKKTGFGDLDIATIVDQLVDSCRDEFPKMLKQYQQEHGAAV